MKYTYKSTEKRITNESHVNVSAMQIHFSLNIGSWKNIFHNKVVTIWTTSKACPQSAVFIAGGQSCQATLKTHICYPIHTFTMTVTLNKILWPRSHGDNHISWKSRTAAKWCHALVELGCMHHKAIKMWPMEKAAWHTLCIKNCGCLCLKRVKTARKPRSPHQAHHTIRKKSLHWQNFSRDLFVWSGPGEIKLSFTPKAEPVEQWD